MDVRVRFESGACAGNPGTDHATPERAFGQHVVKGQQQGRVHGLVGAPQTLHHRRQAGSFVAVEEHLVHDAQAIHNPDRSADR